MRKLSGILVALALVAMAASAQAAKLNEDDILGKWCGETTNYVFTRDRLTVTWHDNNNRRVLRIRKMEFSEDWVDITWTDGGNTVFGEFSADGRRMAQQANTHGDRGPHRAFRRC